MGPLVRHLTRACAFALVLSSSASAQPIAPASIPEVLRDWVPWVVEHEPSYGCTRIGDTLECTFPGTLELTVEGSDVRFSLALVLDRERVVALPGGPGAVPVDVKEGATPLAVLASSEGFPSVRLAAGAHRIEGRIRFGRAPESLRVPPEIARVFAVRGGARMPLERASEGVVALTSAAASPTSLPVESESVSLEITRRIADGAPLTIDTQIVARIGGRARALSLGRVLVPGTVPSAVESTLPIEVGSDGAIVLQATSGTHRIRIRAFAAGANAALTAPSPGGAWPEQEIWLLAPDETYRQIEVRGVPSIDPQTPVIPEDWRSSAAFVLRPGQRFPITELRRGEAEPPPNTLSLRRTLWFDFDGEGFTVRDQLGGEVPRATRLDLLEGQLGRVVVGGQDQLVTMPPGRERDERGARGFELRTTTLDATAEFRLDASATNLPAVGWSEDVNSLEMTLHLPPGHSLLAARGVDEAPEAFVSRWDVGPLFLVLLIGVVFLRLYGGAAGAVAVLTMVLVYHEPDSPRFVWLAALIPAAVLLLFKKGLFARLVYIAWAAASLGLVLIAGSFAATQLRYAMHPQLATEDRYGASPEGGYDGADLGLLRESADEGGMGAVSRSAAPAPSGIVSNLYGGAPGDGASPRDENWVDPNAVVQTGYGVAEWNHAAVHLRWTGPVAKDHRVQLFLARPWLTRVFALARAVGLGFLLVVLFRKRPTWPTTNDAPPPSNETSNPPPGSSEPSPEPTTKESAADANAAEPTTAGHEGTPATRVGLALALFVAALGTAQGAHAQAPTPNDPASGVPSQAMLDELRTRLLAPPPCGARCAQVGDTTIAIEGETLRVTLVAHAAALAALPLPGPSNAFVPDEVRVDGQVSHALRAGAEGHLLLRLAPGVHRVELVASVAGRGAVALAFPEAPAHVSVAANGWTVSGLDENGAVRGSVELRRQLAVVPDPASGANAAEARRGGADVPVWVEVRRELDLGVQWIVHTTVRRLATTSAPAVVRLPALPSETVLGDEAVVEGDRLVVTLAQGIPELRFTSRIRTGTEVALRAEVPEARATGAHRTEIWTYACSPLWSCTATGIAPFRRSDEGVARAAFAPYPGETLTLRAVRLAPSPGPSVTVDDADLQLSPGERATRAVLTLSVRSSVSNTLRLTLPAGAEVERIDVDGARRPTQLRGRELAISVVPGTHSVSIALLDRHGIGLRTTTPRIGIDGSMVDLDLRFEVPANRWLLFASGPSWGPIVLFWGYLVLAIVVALALGRIPRSPLRTHEWALLCIGLLELPMPFTVVVASWFFLARLQHERRLSGLGFNVAQLALGAHAFVAAATLVAAVWMGLTERPDMQVVGNGSTTQVLHWYQDRARDTLPTATVVSVSIWVWKALMLAWAFWLASSVVRWAIWAVTPFREKGFFDPLRRTPPSRPPWPQRPPSSRPAGERTDAGGDQ